jgi:hypothetical protein
MIGKSKFVVVPITCAEAILLPDVLQVSVALALLLNVFQSLLLRKPFAEVLAWVIPITAFA